jgi:flagellar basal body-associated protein FliL
MKLIVRAFVVVLALTGAVATTQISSASTQNKVTANRVSVVPVPTCAPDDPNACGMGLGR